MITVEEIYDRIQQWKKAAADKSIGTTAASMTTANKKHKGGNMWKPDTIENYSVPPFNLPDKAAKSTTQTRYKILSRILTFIELAQFFRERDACTIMPISVTSTNYQAIFGSTMAVSRAIDKMIEIGILEFYDETYRFNVSSFPDDGSRSKRYKYYYDNEQKFIAYCKKHGIEKYEPKNKYEFSQEDDDTNNKVAKEVDFKIEDVRFSSKLDLKMPFDMTKSEFERYLLWCLYKNYPLFAFYQDKIDEINERYYVNYPQFKLRFTPTFTWKNGKWRKKVIKIGIRATNAYDNKSKEERKVVLAEFGMRLQKDIRSSVPRLTKSLNEGEWVDEAVDIYELINQEFEPGAPFTQERRDAIKELHMRAYFEPHSDENMGKNVWRNMVQKGANRQEVYDVMKRLKEAIIKVEGPLYKSEIFYVESCVYIMTLYDLLSAGHNAWLVYDAFYSRGETDPDDFETMIAGGVRRDFQDFYTYEFSQWH